MISYHEFMIGNWFLDKDKPTQVFKVEIDSVNGIIYPYVMAIEITPEILEKCGFKKITQKVFGEMRTSFIKNGFVYISVIMWNAHPLENIKYLHQLQNIYYLLTNQELNYKP